MKIVFKGNNITGWRWEAHSDNGRLLARSGEDPYATSGSCRRSFNRLQEDVHKGKSTWEIEETPCQDTQ